MHTQWQKPFLWLLFTIFIGLPGVSGAGPFDNSLWLGNNGNGLGTLPPILNLDRTGNELRRIDTTDATGIAIDPASNRIYLGTRSGAITVRDLGNPAVVVATLNPSLISSVSFGSDMAFDGTYLWRTDVGARDVQKIDPKTGAVVFSFTPDVYVVGIAWDGQNLWLSEYNGFLGGERIMQYTLQGVPTGVEFPAPSLNGDVRGGGLAFDTTDNTLWVGARDNIYHIDTKGALLGSFANPDISLFRDGLEFQGVGEADTDHDALLDSWETNGIDVDNNGTVDLDLPAMGADPLHKDIFVEIDYMALGGILGHTHKPSNNALQIVINSFNSAPVTNPDGTTGIHIHIDAGSNTIMNPVTNERWGRRSQSNALIHQNNLGTCPEPINGELQPYNWSAFDAIKGVGAPGRFSVQRASVFHYSIWGHNLCTSYGNISGISRGIPSSDFIVTLGGWGANVGNTGSTNQQAGTLMHELGHGLSFKHGGNDHVNLKPNYLSVMNYFFQMRGLWKNGGNGLYDYSRFQLPSLNEAHLNETIGLSGVAEAKGYGTLFCDPTLSGGCNPDSELPGTKRFVNDINGPIDWNFDGDGGTDLDVVANINGDYSKVIFSGFPFFFPIFDILGNTDNWDEIVFNGGAVGHLGANIDLPVVITDPNNGLIEISKEQDANIPTPIAVSVSGPYTASLAPSQSRIYIFTVTNTGDQKGNFNIDAVETQNWSNLAGLPVDISLDPGMSKDISIVVTVPASTAVGSSDLLTVKTNSTENPAMMDSVETTTTVSVPTTTDQCKNNGWKIFGYVNQGQCIQFFNTGKSKYD